MARSHDKREFASKVNSAKMCPYCKGTPKFNKSKHQWECPKCGAKVKADKKGRPLGSVATPQMAYKRWYAHSMIEPLGEQVGRANVYKYLSKVMGRDRHIHTAKLSDIQLDILISILEHTTADEIKERLGLNMKIEDLVETRTEVVDKYEERFIGIENTIQQLTDRIVELEFEKAFNKFENRLRKLGLRSKWNLTFRKSTDMRGVKFTLAVVTKNRVANIVTVKDKYDLTPIMNQCKVEFKMWEGQDKPTFKQWLRKNKQRD